MDSGRGPVQEWERNLMAHAVGVLGIVEEAVPEEQPTAMFLESILAVDAEDKYNPTDEEVIRFMSNLNKVANTNHRPKRKLSSDDNASDKKVKCMDPEEVRKRARDALACRHVVHNHRCGTPGDDVDAHVQKCVHDCLLQRAYGIACESSPMRHSILLRRRANRRGIEFETCICGCETYVGMDTKGIPIEKYITALQVYPGFRCGDALGDDALGIHDITVRRGGKSHFDSPEDSDDDDSEWFTMFVTPKTLKPHDDA